MKEGWKVGPISDFFEVVTGSTPPKNRPELFGRDFPLVKPPELRNGDVISSKDGLSLAGANSARMLPKGAVLVSCIGNLGKIGLAATELATNQQINAIVPNEEQAVPRFTFYLTLSPVFQSRLHGLSTGTTVSIVNKRSFSRIEIFLPSIDEQKRIVAILDEAFAGIEAAIANTEENLDNAREVFSSNLNATFSEAPDSWALLRLDELCSIKHGFAFKSQCFSEAGHYVLLTPGSFWEQGGFRDQGVKTKYYTGEIPKDFLLDRSEFLIAMTEQAKGLLGSSLVVPESDRFLHNQRLGRVLVRDGVQWYNDFFFHQFNTNAFRTAVQATASGVKVRHTSPKKLGDILVKYPPKFEEQAAVAKYLNQMKGEVVKLEHLYACKLNALGELKQSLLHKAFSGELTAEGVEREIDAATA